MQDLKTRLASSRRQVLDARDVIRQLGEDQRFCHDIWDPIIKLSSHPLQVLATKLTPDVLVVVDTHLALLDSTTLAAKGRLQQMEAAAAGMAELVIESEVLTRAGAANPTNADGQTLEQVFADLEGRILGWENDVASLWSDSRDRLGAIATHAPNRR